MSASGRGKACDEARDGGRKLCNVFGLRHVLVLPREQQAGGGRQATLVGRAGASRIAIMSWAARISPYGWLHANLLTLWHVLLPVAETARQKCPTRMNARFFSRLGNNSIQNQL